jgi:hypothetical protein
MRRRPAVGAAILICVAASGAAAPAGWRVAVVVGVGALVVGIGLAVVATRKPVRWAVFLGMPCMSLQQTVRYWATCGTVMHSDARYLSRDASDLLVSVECKQSSHTHSHLQPLSHPLIITAFACSILAPTTPLPTNRHTCSPHAALHRHAHTKTSLRTHTRVMRCDERHHLAIPFPSSPTLFLYSMTTAVWWKVVVSTVPLWSLLPHA